MNSKILILGVDSSLGTSIFNSDYFSEFSLYGTTRKKENIDKNIFFLDLNQDLEEFKLLDLNVSFVVFCASVTSIDFCEKNSEEAFKINVESLVDLAKYFSSKNIKIIFPSTNLVFEGSDFNPGVNSLVTPISEYAKQKVIVENYLLNNCDDSAIIRFGKIIFSEMKLFDYWVDELSQKKTIFPFEDMVFSPISEKSALKIIKDIINNDLKGIFHASSKDDISYFDAATWIRKKMGLSSKFVEPIKAKKENKNILLSKRTALSECFNDNIIYSGIESLNQLKKIQEWIK